MDDNLQQDICRVCRSEGTPERPLYHPCICTGSIKYIHQECLVQWLKYSRKEFCELCNHRFSFMPIYSPDMPKRLPIKDIMSGLVTSIFTAVRYWLHYTLVAVAWLGVVPISSYRIYRCLFSGSFSSVLTLPLDLFSAENLLYDSLHGCFVVMCTLCAFISLVWLREQILHGGGPDWLEQVPAPENNNGEANVGNENGAEVALVAEEDGGNGPVVAAANAVNEVNNGAQDDNWNPIEWERAAEELTWERLLGLDGSLVFLEHVFWVVSLNTLFVLLFAFCPYHIGNFAVMGFKVKEYLVATQFEGLLTTLFGYFMIGVCLVVLHSVTSLLKFKKSKRMLGLSYVVVKVSLLSVVEIGIFPLVCGWWLDICSLAIFDASLKDRLGSFKLAPGTSMFIHWLIGMVYVFYFASLILLLREVLRPGVLWFLRNLNDPDFNPIQEMIHLPILRHTHRFLASMMIFGTTVLIMLWIPVNIIRKYCPGFLPYNVILTSETPVSELSLELLLLQVILPALMEQGHTRIWLRGLVKTWCLSVSWLLDLHSYLLGDDAVVQEDDAQENVDNNQQQDANDEANEVQPAPRNPVMLPPPPPPPPPVPENAGFQLGALGAAHQALLQGGGPTGFQPYKRSNFFAIRILCLLVIMCLSLMVVSLITLTVPVFIGRKLMALWLGSTHIHELYTAACGLYACWLGIRLTTILCSWDPHGWNAVIQKLKHWAVLTSKAFLAMVVLLGIIPLLLGFLFELVVVVPLRVPLTQSPIFFVWQVIDDWALGVLHTKIICALTMMGPNWWLKRVIEQVYQDGVRNLNLGYIFRNLAFPVIIVLGLALATPYVVACNIVPIFGVSFATKNLVLRRIYPATLAIFFLLGICMFQVRQFWRLYEHIKNDKYLVGRRLVNYEHKPKTSTGTQTSETRAAQAL